MISLKKRKSKPLHDSAPTASACDLLCEMHQKGDNPCFCGGRELRKGWEQQRGLAEGPGAERGLSSQGWPENCPWGVREAQEGPPTLDGGVSAGQWAEICSRSRFCMQDTVGSSVQGPFQTLSRKELRGEAASQPQTHTHTRVCNSHPGLQEGMSHVL